MTRGLTSGDKVIDLVGLVQNAGVVGAALAGAVMLWVTKQSLWLAVGAFFGAAVCGFFIGNIVGRMLFPAPSGNVTVVKAGASSLSSTMKAAISGASLAAAIMGGLVAFFTSATGGLALLVGLPIGIGIITGLLLAMGASLT